ncbi:MAG: desulfoferrodoxin [Candidatus Thermoplasmatota archaeon]|nr:desulfoferrodoxin [Candidatus Thermoplasmatota archaeon]
MTKVKEVYKCAVCGNIVEVLHAGVGELVCCGQPMELLVEKQQDAGNEKHVPVIEKTASGVKVKVGSVPHPMEEKHYIEWIELHADDTVYRKFLKPMQKPEAEFHVTGQNLAAREYCSIHGLWKSK